MPQVAWLINNRNLLPTVLEPGSLRPACQHGWEGALFQAAGFSLPPRVAEGGAGSLGSVL